MEDPPVVIQTRYLGDLDPTRHNPPAPFPEPSLTPTQETPQHGD